MPCALPCSHKCHSILRSDLAYSAISVACGLTFIEHFAGFVDACRINGTAYARNVRYCSIPICFCDRSKYKTGVLHRNRDQTQHAIIHFLPFFQLRCSANHSIEETTTTTTRIRFCTFFSFTKKRTCISLNRLAPGRGYI